MEAYSSAHPETIDELLSWPWQRFEKFYESFMRRSAVESFERRRDIVLQSLLSNPSSEKSETEKAIRNVEEEFMRARYRVYHGTEDEYDPLEDEDNVFFGAMSVPGEHLMDSTTERKVKTEFDIDQVD